jgi:hypothetical protein
MGAPGEVEFFVDGGASLPALDEDSVDFGQGQVPRWAVVIVALLVAAVVAALAAQPQHKPAAAAPTPEPVISIVSPSSTSGLGIPIPIDQATPVIDLAVSVPLFLLQPGHLYKITDATAFGVSLNGSGFTRLGTSARLVLDAAANRVWVVEAPGGEIIEFDARNLHRLRTMHSQDSIRDAAALRGHLYLATSSGLADVAPGASEPRILPGLSGFVASVAADPKRGRLLALVLGNGASIRQVTVAGTVSSAPGPAPVPVGGGMLRVTTDGTIWLGGFGSAIDGAVLARLDPKTLKPVLGSPVARRLGGSSWIEAAGDHDIWIRSGGDGDGLWCVDGRTGGILQYWPRVQGAVTSRDGAAFVLMEGLLVPIVMQDCTG